MPKKKIVYDDAYYFEHCIGRAQAHGNVVAYEEFITFLNPKYRGINFKWQDFEKMTVELAEATVYQQFSDIEWKHFEKQIKETAKKSAKFNARHCLEASGILEWWSNE